MNTNRITFIDLNESAYLPGGKTDIVGATVIRAPRGVSEPILLESGSSMAIQALFGRPTKDYPDIQEAIEFNNTFSLYVSAPPGVKTGSANYYGGVYITTEGSVEPFYKVSDPEAPSFSAEFTAASASSVFTSGSVKSAYNSGNHSFNISNIKNEYFVQSKIEQVIVSYTDSVDEVQTILLKVLPDLSVVTDDVNEYEVGEIVSVGGFSTITFTGNALVTNFDLTASGALDVYLTDADNYATLSVKWIYNIEEYVIQTLYQTSPRSSVTKFKISGIEHTENTDPLYNTMTFNFTEVQDSVDEYASPSIVASTDPSKLDGFNGSLYIDNVLNTKALWYIGSKVYKQYTDITGTFTFPITKSVAGTRIMSPSLIESEQETSLIVGWDEMIDPKFEAVHIAFDNSGFATLKTKMANLRSNSMKMSTFLSPIKEASSDTTTAVVNIITSRSSFPKTLGGLGYTCNEFMLRDGNNKEYWSPIIGSVATNYALIMRDKLGGAAPMFTNDGNNLGGQLNRAVRKQKYKFTADQLDDLDAAGINPIILDSYYGLMLTSEKTAANPVFLTDWSFFGHSMAFDLLKMEIKKNVLIPQLGKAISPFYLELRQSQTESIVNKRLAGTTSIWTDAKVLVNDTSVNNDDTKSMNKFVVKVRVKVTPFTEYIEFVLNNVDQKTTV